MTVQYNLKNPDGLKKGDILVFDGKKFDVITKEQIIKDLQKEFQALKQEVEMLRNQTNQIKVQVNQKQKRFLGAFVKKVK